MRLALVLILGVTACTDRGTGDGGSETAGSEQTAGSEETAAPDCGTVDAGARAEFWVEGPSPAQSTDGDLECTVDSVRLAMDDLDVEIDIDCGDTIDKGDTGATTLPWTIKLGPAVERPTIAAGDAVTFRFELPPVVACDEPALFWLWRDDGELIAAGLRPAAVETVMETGAAGPLTLQHGNVAESCLGVTASLGGSSVLLRGGSSEVLGSGDVEYRIEVGSVRLPEGVGDDCGGNATLYDAIVIRSP